MSPPSVSRQHADWLGLVPSSGPFVSLPVLMRAFPQGLDARDPVQAKALREAFEDWQDNPAAAGKQRAWVLHVLTTLLGYPGNQIVEGQSLPAGLEARMPEMGETLRPDLVLVGPTGTDSAGKAQLLIVAYPAEQALDKPVTGRHWKATPATRMMELLHGAGVPVGLVTNGEQWMLVFAPRGEVTGYASWYASLWLDEPITLRAFHSLLGVRRFFGVAADGTLQALLKESASDQQEVTDQLGYQVREAVEVLVQSFDALDKESKRTLLKGVSPSSQYDAALTVMMRLVFLFSAEERGLLHLGKPLYDDNYAVSTLQEQLQEVADQHGEEVLERRSDAWARLLASFRAVHGGIRHQDLLMQAYGGSLFDPDRYAFLEGRAAGSPWRSTAADPLAVNNRVVLHLLNSLQRLRIKGGAGGATETRRISFRALGVEQIGHVYEGLLDHTAVRATEPVLGLKGTRSKEPEIALAKLESLLAQGQDKLIEFLKEETGRSDSAIRRTLDEVGLLSAHRLQLACSHDETLLARLRPFIGLIRSDSFDQPLVMLTGSVFVTVGSTRRSTGAHYTPPSLTQPVVQHTLEPLVYFGPDEGKPRQQWKLKSPKEILSLKVCDMAMGSGAFLVQVCRYLAERLTEAWDNEEGNHPGEMLITPDGAFSKGDPCERLVPADANERIAIARRVVADRCLYGVDINPMAVEMAKLSVWLLTVDASRPFNFLDHAFKCGDSLLGTTSVDQMERFSLRPSVGKLQGFNAPGFAQHIREAKDKREALEGMPSDTAEQIASKAKLYLGAQAAVARLNEAADVLMEIELRGLTGRAYDSAREASAESLISRWATETSQPHDCVQPTLAGRHFFHWALSFPEVISNGGFHAFVGNPPFYAGAWLKTLLGDDYRRHIVVSIAEGQTGIRGTADLCVYFLLRARQLKRRSGVVGLILSNAVLEGDSKAVGISSIVQKGSSIVATSGQKWPGGASVIVVSLWLYENEYFRGYLTSEAQYNKYLPLATSSSGLREPHSLAANASLVCKGHELQGNGFKLNEEEARGLVEVNKRNAEVVFPLIMGETFNSSPSLAPAGYVINFGERTLDEARAYAEPFSILEDRVKPERDLYTGNTGRDRYLRQYWWLFRGYRKDIEEHGENHDRMLVCTVHTKYLAFAFIKSNIVCTPSMFCFLFDKFCYFTQLQSSIHDAWASHYASAIGEGQRYVAGRCFNTFPLISDAAAQGLEALGIQYHDHRASIMAECNIGLTDTYNRFHNEDDTANDISVLRRLHEHMDKAVALSYGWQDLELDHGFQKSKQGVRYTISEAARQEVLDRLLALNHQRHAEEVAGVAALTVAVPRKRGRKPKDSGNQTTFDM